MKIRTFLVAGILSTVIVIGSTVVGLVTASRNYHQALKHSRLENEISLGVFQLTALTFDYGQHEGGLIRAKRQWIVKHRSLEKLLKYPGNSDEIEIFGLNKLLSILNKAQALFVQAVSINEDLQKSGADLPIVKAQKRMLLAQVQTLIQNMSSEVSYLSANSSLVLQETTEKSERLIFLLLILLLIFMVVLVVLVGLQVVGPLRRLQEGISNFAAGDLDFRFNFSSRDEIGNVANSFNEMADKLHLTTVARDDLQKEISEQKQLEFGKSVV